MGKVLKALGVVFLVLIIGFVLLMVWAHGEGEEQQKRFFDAVATGNPDTLLALMDKRLSADMDPPVVKMWMDHINDALGKYQGMGSSFNTEKKTVEDGTLVMSSGTAKFEKGEAEVELTVLNDKFTGYQIMGKAVESTKWLKKPETDLYANRAKQFLEHLSAGRIAEARKMMHKNLREVPGTAEAKVADGMKKFAATYGPLKTMEVIEQEWFDSGDDKSLVVWVKCVYEKGECLGRVQFNFGAAKGHLWGFNLPARPKTPN